MTNHDTIDDGTECGLHRFERNRFFHGKLMTARDMQAEQRYHRSRLRTLAEHVTGRGIVSGLETTVEADDGSLVVTIDPGLAIDGCGRPIVVATQTTEQFDLDELSDPVSLYVGYDDCVRETVPVPGAEDACEEECTYNRILEIFEVTPERDPPDDQKPVETIEFPERSDYATDGDARDPTTIDGDDDTLRRIATSYDPDDTDDETTGDRRIFLGRFGSDENENWSRVTGSDVEARPQVYTNDMLYAAIARHVADFDNPHEVIAAQTGALVSVEGVSNPGGNVDLFSSDDTISAAGINEGNRTGVDLKMGDGLSDRLSELENGISDLESDVETLESTVGDLESEVGDLEARLDASHRQLLRSTLHHKRLSFRLLVERFDVRPAAEVVELTTEGIEEEVYREPEAYVEFIEELVDLERAVADAISNVEAVDRTGLDQYANAVEELRRTLDRGPEEFDEREFFTAVARAQELVAETVEWIDASASDDTRPTEEPVDEPVDESTGEDALRESMVMKTEAFKLIRDRFDVGSADEVLEITDQALNEEAYTSSTAYRGFIEEVVQSEKGVVEELVDSRAVANSIGDYSRAVASLERSVDEEANITSLRERQVTVAEQARALDPEDEQIESPIMPSELTVEQLQEEVAGIERVQDAKTVLALELTTGDRSTAKNLILQRIQQLEA